MSILGQFSLAGKVAFVSGGAGLYGRQIVQALAEAGAITYVGSRNLESLQQQAQQWRNQGFKVSALHLDQEQERSVSNALQQIVAAEGRLHILVNNAVLRTMRDWNDPAENFTRSMAVNATGIFMMTRTFGEHMAEHGSGSIINISSIQGMVGPDFTLYEDLSWSTPPDYFFHKGGMLQLTKFAASKLGPRNVRVNAVSPGGFYTDQDPKFVERYNARTFLRRMANESDLAGAVVFLASDASAYITGANLPVDGGYTAK